MDIPEGLPVPSVSAPPASIPKWNAFHGNWLVPLFDFATEYLKDHGALLVMYPASSPHKAQLLACCEEYGFRIAQSWLGMNRLCRSTKTQVNPSSALNRTKHHQSNPSNVPGILDSILSKRVCVYTSKSLLTWSNRILPL